MTPATNSEPVDDVERSFRELIGALRRLRELRTVVRESKSPPDDIGELAKELQQTVAHIRMLQRRLLKAELTPGQQGQIRKLLTEGPGTTDRGTHDLDRETDSVDACEPS